MTREERVRPVRPCFNNLSSNVSQHCKSSRKGRGCIFWPHLGPRCANTAWATAWEFAHREWLCQVKHASTCKCCLVIRDTIYRTREDMTQSPLKSNMNPRLGGRKKERKIVSQWWSTRSTSLTENATGQGRAYVGGTGLVGTPPSWSLRGFIKLDKPSERIGVYGSAFGLARNCMMRL